MDARVSKSAFKARALEYLREIERTGRDLIVTDRGRPVVRIVPYRRNSAEAPAGRRHSTPRSSKNSVHRLRRDSVSSTTASLRSEQSGSSSERSAAISVSRARSAFHER